MLIAPSAGIAVTDAQEGSLESLAQSDCLSANPPSPSYLNLQHFYPHSSCVNNESPYVRQLSLSVRQQHS